MRMLVRCMHGSCVYGAAFLCVADEAYGRILPAAYLDKLAADFAAEVGDKLPKEGVQEGQLTPTYS